MDQMNNKKNQKQQTTTPFEGPYKTKKSAVPGKAGLGYSTARHLARTALKKVMAKEETQIDEVSKKTLGSYISKASVDMANRTADATHKKTQAGADYAHSISRGMSVKQADAGMKKDYDAAKPDVKKAVKRMYGIDKAVSRLTKEEVEQVDEISSDMLRKAKHKAYALSSKADDEGKTKEADKRFSQGVRFQNREYDVSKKEGQKLSKYMAQKEEVETGTEEMTTITFKAFRTSLIEKTLTAAEMKKREEVAKAIERENPKMPMGKKMAIATATAKKVAEDMHYCAKHVYSKLYGEGLVVEGEHAEPDAEGQIEWYTVEFAHGKEVVFTEDVRIMAAEYHMNHKPKKKKMSEEEQEVEEELKGNQHKIDANKNGKIDAHDFQLLRAKKNRTK